MAIQKVVSGGQTGVDRAALDVARALGTAHGGWCPKGRRAEDGSIDSVYMLKETPSEAYEQRTEWNVRDSDGTLLLTDGGEVSGGTALARSVAHRLEKPVLHARTTDAVPVVMIRAWCEDNDIRVLNVAGPRESERPGIYEDARAVLDQLLREEAETNMESA
jgi:hypothetical protein